MVVDGANGAFLQLVGLFRQTVASSQHPLEHFVQILLMHDAIFLGLYHIAIEVAVGSTLYHCHLDRKSLRLDISLQNPAKIEVNELAVAGLDQITGQHLTFFTCQWQSCGSQAFNRHQLTVIDFTNQHTLVTAGVFQLPLIDRVGPEVDQTTPADQQQQTQYRYQAQADGTAGHPDPGGP